MTSRSMRVAVASGKGGTGKTTVAVSLARYLADSGTLTVCLSDADVEAPNAHIFLEPHFTDHLDVYQYIPEVDQERCTGCGICAEVCQFNAIVILKDRPKLFPALCHGCGSCLLQCPQGSIQELPYTIGRLDRGLSKDGLLLCQGLLNEGEPMAVPVITRLMKWAGDDQTQVEIIDSPPGASCPVVEALRGADYVLLVTEPTPFGLHDLRQALQVTRELGLDAGVIINKVGLGQTDIAAFCRAENVPVWMEIPLERTIAEGLARGSDLFEIEPAYQTRFTQMWEGIQSAVGTVVS